MRASQQPASTPMKHPGITAQAVAQATTLIRTALVSAFNSARLKQFAEEGVEAIEWVSVIDDVTTDICLALDGKQWLLPDDPTDYAAYIPIGHDTPFIGPVGHWNCRSVQVPVTPDEGALPPTGIFVGYVT
jgi:SPP1 gp7 family putative phage head morphogenesis protein